MATTFTRNVAALVCYVLSLVFFNHQSAHAEENYWPGWLGPERNGWVADFKPPSQWPQDLKQTWTVEVGTGYATPLVANGRIYQYARQGEEEVLLCFDLQTGNSIWRKSYEVPFTMGGGGEWHGKGPKAAPILADGRIFTMSISGILSGWNAESGDLLWRRDYAQRFKKTTPYWGACTSPIVDEDRVIVHFGNDDEGVLVALNVETGKEVWTQGKDGAAYASPLLVEINGVRQIVEWNHRVLAGIESKTGKLLWEIPFAHAGTNQNMPTPVFYDGSIIVGGENRGIRRVEPKLDGDAWSANELWHQKKVALDMSTAVLNGDKLFGFSHLGKGRLFCIAAETGDILWQGPGRTGDNATFLSISDHVVALLDNGELQIIKATGESYIKTAFYQVSDATTWAAPVLLSSGVLIKDRNTLALWSW